MHLRAECKVDAARCIGSAPAGAIEYFEGTIDLHEGSATFQVALGGILPA
jgi:hypothetical protein